MPRSPSRNSKTVRPHRFCMACGSAIDVRVPPSRMAPPGCGSCGSAFSSGPIPAVGVAVVESGRVLLIRRRFPPMQGAWAIPGGFMEGRESPEHTARREIEEETGLKVQLAGVLGVYRGGGPGGRVLLLCFRGVVRGGRLCAGDDASDVGFFPLWQLPEPLAVGPHPIVLEQLRSSLAREPGSP